MRMGIILCVALIFAPRMSFAVDADYAKVKQHLSFGTILQTSENSTLTIGTDGQASSITGLTLISSGLPAIVNYAIGNGAVGHRVTPANPATTTDFELDGCTVTLTSGAASPSSFSIYAIFGQSQQDVNIGATLTIRGFCKEGSYPLTYEISSTANLGYNVETAYVTATVVFQEKLKINKTQDMDFGTILSPATNGTVVLSYNGQRSPTNGILLMSTREGSQGAFTVEGTSGRTVYVTLPSEATIYSGTNSLTVNNFVIDKGTTFSLSADSVPINIGATLNLPANTPAGEYSGTYTITVSY